MIAKKILTFRKLGSSVSISFLSSFLVKAFPCLPSWAYLLNTVIMDSMDFSKSVMAAEMSAERRKGRNGNKYHRFFFLLQHYIYKTVAFFLKIFLFNFYCWLATFTLERNEWNAQPSIRLQHIVWRGCGCWFLLALKANSSGTNHLLAPNPNPVYGFYLPSL